MNPQSINLTIIIPVFCSLLQIPLFAGKEDSFYTQDGSDPTFAEVMKSGKLPRGKNSRNGFKGSKVKINHDELTDSPNAHRPLLKEILIHTLGHSAIRRNEFSKWSRWYQEDGNTQIFRLFKGEENVRNSRKLAARIEAHSEFNWEKGEWQEWVATYTIIKPHNCAIFQSKNPKNDWAVMINMNANGDVFLNHRRGEDKFLARNMTGKPFHIRIRDNGYDYEVYFNGKKEGSGSYTRPKGAKTNFRWGMYLGAKEVKNDAMILVTGAAINPKDPEGKITKPKKSGLDRLPKPEPEKGLPIPTRTWTNKKGESVKAPALYELGTDFIKLNVNGKWVDYPIENLSQEDRKVLDQAVKESEK